MTPDCSCRSRSPRPRGFTRVRLHADEPYANLHSRKAHSRITGECLEKIGAKGGAFGKFAVSSGHESFTNDNGSLMMNRQQTIQTVRDYLAGQPVRKAWLFGSFARGEETGESDIDILFEPDFSHGSFPLLTHGGMYEDLKALLGREVDLVADGSLRPYAKDSADHDKILIYSRTKNGLRKYAECKWAESPTLR